MFRELLVFFFLDLIVKASSRNAVYVSNGTHIVSYTRQNQEINSVLGQRDHRIVGLAADIARNILFWSDISPEYGGIYCSDLNGNNIVKIIDDIGEVNSVTVDWVSAHIYWTDVERRTVEVAEYDGRYRKVLVSTDLKKPLSIVAAPLFGYLFWVDERNHRIERALLDGSHRRTLVKFRDSFPKQLSVSISRKMLFWVDAAQSKSGVYSCKLNGKGVKKQLNYASLSNGSPAYGLLVFGNTAIISTWFNTTLYAMMLDSRRQFIWQQLAAGIGTRELFDVVSLNPDTQVMTTTACSEKTKGGCSDLCLPTRKNDYICACPTYGNKALSPDGKTCLLPEEILLVAMETRGQVGFIPLPGGEISVVGRSPQPVSVAFDRQAKRVYWSDVSDSAIYTASLDSSDKTIYLNKSQGIGRVTSMQFLQGKDILYFINNSPTGYSTLERVFIDTGHRETVIKNLKSPVDFVLDEYQKCMFILVAGETDNASVLRASLDGSDVIVEMDHFMDPSAFVVNGNLLMVAERFNHDTILTEKDMHRSTIVSTQLDGQSVDLMTSKGHEIFLMDNRHGKLLFMNNSKPTILLEDVQLTDLLYTETTSYILPEDDFNCSEHDCTCLTLPPNHERCSCAGKIFHAKDENKTCKEPENFLLFVDKTTINLLSLDLETTATPTVVSYGDIETVISSLTYDAETYTLYWIDIPSHSIFLMHTNMQQPVRLLLYKDNAPIDNLVLDSLRKRLYWTGESGGEYFIASFNVERGLSSYKRVFRTRNKLLSLAFHDDERWLYFGEEDSYEPFVSKCKTNGRRHTRVIISGLIAPTSLVAVQDRLYVGEMTGGIVMFNLEEGSYDRLFIKSTKISGLAVYENSLVFTDIQNKSIQVLDLTTGRVGEILVRDLQAPSSLVIHHPKHRTDFCSLEAKCSDICVPLLRDQYICDCAEGRLLNPDKTTCEDKTPPSTEKPTTTTKQITAKTEIDVFEQFEESSTEVTDAISELTTVRQNKTIFDGAFYEDLLESATTATTLSQSPSTTTQTTKKSTTSESIVAYETKTTSVQSHAGEPKPTQTTRIYETTEDFVNSYGLLSPEDEDNHLDDLNELPYFENCPKNKTLLLPLSKSSRSIEVPIRPMGYSSSGARLPLHCNYELTKDGIILEWDGDATTSKHDVIFSVTDSRRQTTQCELTIVLQDEDPPVFTFCPSTYKVATDTSMATVNWTEPEVHDNVGIKRLVSSHSSGSQLEAGEYLVNYTAEDYAGNHAHCVFMAFVLHDKLCNIESIPHGGIVCANTGSSYADCRIICEAGHVVNPIRIFRQRFNCKHPDDVDAINSAMATQKPCLKHKYPSVMQQQYQMVIHGPISEHKTEVQANVSVAIAGHLERERLCFGEVCEVGDVKMKCEEDDVDWLTGSNVTCLDEIDRTEFFITFNITLRNDTKTEEELDVLTMSENIHTGLQRLASLLQWHLGDHMFNAVSESLTRSQISWSCHMGQIAEDNICISCPPGTFHNISMNVCQYCSTGYYQDAQGQVTCHSCDAGRTSPDGATSHDQCHTLPSMDEMTLFIIVTTCSFGVVFLCMAVTLYLQFQRQQKRNQQIANQKKTRYNMTPNLYVAPPPILKSKLDDNLSPGERTYSIDRKHPINIFANHDYEDVGNTQGGGSLYSNDVFNMLQGQGRDFSPGDEVPTGTLSRENTFSNPTYSPQFSLRRYDRGSLQRSIHTPSPGPNRKMSHDSTFSSQSPRYIIGTNQRTPTSDTPLITQSPLLRMKLAAYNLNHED